MNDWTLAVETVFGQSVAEITITLDYDQWLAAKRAAEERNPGLSRFSRVDQLTAILTCLPES
jgi:hypothetical protein